MDSKFCFPVAAEMYRTNPDGITWRVKQVLARALEAQGVAEEGEPLRVATADEIQAKGLAYIDRLGRSSRAEKMLAVFTAYMDGQNLDAVTAADGLQLPQ